MPELTTSAKVFILAEMAVATLVFAFAVQYWSWSQASTFLFLLGLSAATGAMKVRLPGVQGSLSVLYVLLMWGMVNMSLGETLLIGWVGTLVQSYWRYKKRPTAIQNLFNLSVIPFSLGFATLAFKANIMQDLIPNRFLRIFLAALVYFVGNTFSVATVIGLTERLPVWNVWRKSYGWSFPHYLLSASLVCAVDYLRKKIGLEVALLILPAAYLLYQTFLMNITRLNEALERAEQERRHVEETALLHLRTIRALALAIEAKDETTSDHLHRVQTYAIELGKDFDLPPEEMDALRAAAILHDVGKLAVPEYIISKPGKLTPGEFAKMKIHTVVGAEIVESVNFPFAVAPLVRSHHEKWDGSGYPDGLKGEEIPFGARILTAVDCLDALASDRQYRKAMPLDQAMSIIVAESGKSFDPQVVAALNKRCHELESLARSTLQQDSMKFSVDMTIDRGLAPDAGFAAESQHSHPGSALVREEIARELSILNSIAVRIGQLESIEADLSAIEPLLRELIPFDSMALYRLCGDKLQCIFAHGEAAEFLLGLSIQTGEGVSGWTVANRTPLRNGNAVTEFGIAGEMHAGFTLVAGLSIPLDSEFGTIGALTLYNHRRDAFETSHLRTLLALGSRLAYQLNLDFSGLSRTAPDPYFSDGAPGLQISRLSEVIESHTVGASPEVARLS